MNQWFSKIAMVFWMLACVCGAADAGAGRDVVLLMESPLPPSNENGLSADSVISPLLQQLTASDQLGVFTYRDNRVNVLQVLENISSEKKTQLSVLLDQALADTSQMNAAAMLERAIYELRTNGSGAAEKLVIIVGNGVVEDANSARNDKMLDWMRNDLVQESSRLGIRIYWLTYSESADYQLIQTVTRNTDGSYFRIFDPAAASAAIDNIFTSASSGSAGNNRQADLAGQADQEQQGSTGLNVLAQYPVLLIAVSGFLLSGAVALVLVYLRKRNGLSNKQLDTPPVSDRVMLLDASNFTGRTEYDITARTTYISRQPREVTQNSCVIVIRDTSVSREHATITCRDNGYWINDSGGVNGTYVNNERVQNDRLLRNGDRIRFAKFEFEFVSPDFPAGPQSGRELSSSDSRSQNPVDEDVTLLRDRKH